MLPSHIITEGAIIDCSLSSEEVQSFTETARRVAGVLMLVDASASASSTLCQVPHTENFGWSLSFFLDITSIVE